MSIRETTKLEPQNRSAYHTIAAHRRSASIAAADDVAIEQMAPLLCAALRGQRHGAELLTIGLPLAGLTAIGILQTSLGDELDSSLDPQCARRKAREEEDEDEEDEEGDEDKDKEEDEEEEEEDEDVDEEEEEEEFDEDEDVDEEEDEEEEDEDEEEEEEDDFDNPDEEDDDDYEEEEDFGDDN